MATPAIWRPPKYRIPGLGRTSILNTGILKNIIGAGRTTPFLGGAARDAILGRNQAPEQRTNPYASMLQDYLNQARADFAAQGAAEKGDMINAIRRAMISYGASPNFDAIGGLGKDAQGYLKQALDKKTLDLMQNAEKEGLSAHARFEQGNVKARRFIPAQNASRGILFSGQTGADLGDQAMQEKQGGYDMLTELLNGITGNVSSYQNAERERQRQLAEIEMQTAMQLAQDWGDSDMGPEPSGPVPTDPGRPTNTRPTRPPRPGPNYYWNGKRWVYRRPAGGAGGGTAKVM